MTTKDKDMSEQSNELSQAFVDKVAQTIAEFCDRNSPEEYPDCMLVTYDELNEVMHAVHEDVPAVDCAPLLARIAELEAKLEVAEKDAERYRWLRGNGAIIDRHEKIPVQYMNYGVGLDTAIDVLMQGN